MLHVDKKHRPFILAITAIIIIGIGHVVPLRTLSGIEADTSGLCIGNEDKRNQYYRLLLGQGNDFTAAQNQLIPYGTNEMTTMGVCGSFVTAKLYLW